MIIKYLAMFLAKNCYTLIIHIFNKNYQTFLWKFPDSFECHVCLTKIFFMYIGTSTAKRRGW